MPATGQGLGVPVEGLGQYPLARNRDNADRAAGTTEPTATGRTAMQQVREPGGVHDVDMPAAGPLLLCKHQLLAVLPLRVEHWASSKIPVHNQGHGA